MNGPLTIDLSKGTASVDGYTLQVKTTEQVFGTASGDNMKGSKDSDSLYGGKGDDILRGGLSADKLVGGEGADTFVFTKADAADGTWDYVSDFEVGVDHLDVSNFGTGKVQLVNSADGTMVQGLVNGTYQDIALLVNVHVDTAHLADLLA